MKSLLIRHTLEKVDKSIQGNASIHVKKKKVISYHYLTKNEERFCSNVRDYSKAFVN